MRCQLKNIVALTIALAPGIGNAIGFGEITLKSRIGEPLMAEVPILTTAEEQPSTACFSLEPIRGSELPVITAAKIKLIRRGQNHVLQVFGNRPISDPIFAIAVQAGCGHSVVRDYVLMPEAPFMLAEAAISSAPITTAAGKRTKLTEWHARDGETLEDIADAQVPTSLVERQRLIAALKRANPDLSPETALTEGSVVRIPARKQWIRTEQKEIRGQATQEVMDENAPKKVAAPSRKAKPSAPPPLPMKGTDQLRLGAAPEEVKPQENGNSPRQSLAETEQRILRLETTLHLLTQEVEKIDQALELATKAIEIQNKLQLAQASQPTQAPVTVNSGAVHVPAKSSTTNNWLELLLSAAAGAAISVGFVQHLRRRNRYPDDEPPLAFAPQHTEEVTTTKIPQALPTINFEDASAQPSIPAPHSAKEQPSASDENIEVKMEDDDSVLALAEIMLSFGRVRGAVETLAEHIDEHMPKNIQPWSMLLDLYRRGGMRQEFTVLAEKMRARFNASIPDWNDSNIPVSGLKTLEDYPHVVQKTMTCWGTADCMEYLLSLVHDTRAGQRNGFPLEVVGEIALLMQVLDEAYGLKRPR